jgi:hypothetical protein
VVDERALQAVPCAKQLELGRGERLALTLERTILILSTNRFLRKVSVCPSS